MTKLIEEHTICHSQLIVRLVVCSSIFLSPNLSMLFSPEFPASNIFQAASSFVHSLSYYIAIYQVPSSISCKHRILLFSAVVLQR